MRAALVLSGCVLLVLLTAGASAARADVFGPISLASDGQIQGSTTLEQANDAEYSDLSADGRYVTFEGSIGAKNGIFRRDLVTGEIATVVEGDATLPSISADGRYISFTTTARLDMENDDNSAPDVYVRDMDDPVANACGEEWEQDHEACAFTLVSAANESSKALQYEYPEGQGKVEERIYGSLASGRTALSANGQRVAFITTAVSNLAGGEHPTPKLQVALRDLASKRTELVSVLYRNGEETAEPVPTSAQGYGAVYPGASNTPRFGESPYAGASISADGSTVAWMGQEVGEQAPVLASDVASQPQYTEPLWRRVGEGPHAPTRRVTGGSDPTIPQCTASGETQLSLPATLSDPCQGPFTVSSLGGGEAGLWENGVENDYRPQLSANGMTVAFLASARWIADGEEFKTGESSDDLYTVDMRDGLTRVQAASQLTELAGGVASDTARVAPIVDLGISADGSQVAFTSERTVFPLGSPAYVSAPAAAVGIDELYDVDLADDTLTRVTQGFDGQPSEAPENSKGLTASPSFSENDELLAFSSSADNLVYGDGNDASDAFVVARTSFAPAPTPEVISPPPANPAPLPAWDLSVTATSQGDGGVLLYVVVPGAGTLRAGAHSAVRVRSATTVGDSSRRRARPAETVDTRTVAARSGVPATGGLLELPLALAKRYAPLAKHKAGLYATVALTFAAPGHPTLHKSIGVRFRRASRSSGRPR